VKREFSAGGLVIRQTGKEAEIALVSPILKSVTFFLFRYCSGSVDDHDDEVIWAGWVPLEQAPEQLSYDGEREMAAKALARGAT